MNEKKRATGLADSLPTGSSQTPTRSNSPVVNIGEPKDTSADSVPGFKREIHGLRWVLTVGAILACFFMYALDTTVVADIQPDIVAALGDFQKFPWLATAYVLPSTALVLIQSKMYGHSDIKWLYFGYVVCFEIGSAIPGNWDRPRSNFAAPILIFILPAINFAKGQSIKERMNKIDWLGLAVWTGWCVSFFMAIIFGGTLFEWQSFSMIILWILVGIVGITFFLAHKLYTFVEKDNRLYPSHMLRSFKLDILQFATFAAASAVYISIYYIPLYFQFARGESPVEAAIKLLPFVFIMSTVAILNGIIMSYRLDRHETIGNLRIQRPTCPNDIFNAIGVIILLRCISITLFPSLSGNILQNLGPKYITPILPCSFDGDPRVILAGASSPEWQSFSEDVQSRLSGAIVDAMSNVYTMTIVASGITALLSPLWGGGGSAK
ncbi:hypothetical protein N8I77_008867 [Diaporthe amygdali]|uniref:Uncharacterized protein n=1 Tax=Phomopsis amygdali TaxID=1214568 RepID=A0AAD9S8M3_PHOAM|nr:hypothetical protein N8I77_008867 [Diaporthe amygdali]